MKLVLSIVSISLFLITAHAARAEDWTSTDGKTYKGVKVIKVEDDAVTILDSNGGALVMLANLPPDLQSRFHYNAEKAKIAAAKRAAADQAEADAVKAAQTTPPATPAAAPVPVQTSPITPPPAPAPGLVAQATPPPPAAEPAPAPSTPKPSSTQPMSQFALNRGQGANDAAHDAVNPNWKLVWSDEFDGPEIDKSKWNFEIDGKGGGNGELEYYTDKKENAHIEDGCLVITAIKDGTDAEGRKHKFTSARMTTKNNASWKYGRMEARIKLPTGRGVWPAFWMMPQDSVYGGWPHSGEIDILEEVGDKPNTAFGTIHYGESWPKNTHTGDKIELPNKLSEDFHVYAVEWEEGVIRWYVDGKLYQTQTRWFTPGHDFPAPFDQKFFIILNFAVGGAWPGKPSPDTKFPQSMLVDYVRVYQPQ